MWPRVYTRFPPPDLHFPGPGVRWPGLGLWCPGSVKHGPPSHSKWHRNWGRPMKSCLLKSVALCLLATSLVALSETSFANPKTMRSSASRRGSIPAQENAPRPREVKQIETGRRAAPVRVASLGTPVVRSMRGHRRGSLRLALRERPTLRSKPSRQRLELKCATMAGRLCRPQRRRRQSDRQPNRPGRLHARRHRWHLRSEKVGLRGWRPSRL